VHADVPGERVVVGGWFEIGEECDSGLEGGQFARGDGREAAVVEGAVVGSVL